MKKILFFFASALMLAACENYYIDKNLGGSDYNPTDVRTVDYTLTDADYKNIVSNKENVAIALAECTPEDSSAYTALLQVANDLAFNNVAVADVYVPAFLAAKFPQFSKGSLFNVTYKTTTGRPAYLSTFANTTKYTLSPADYETIWEGKTGINYLTPATMSNLTSVLPEEGEAGDILAVVYEYKSQEPIFETEEEDVPQGFFDGTPESRGFYTTSEAIAAAEAGLIAKGDSMIDAGVNEGDYVVIRKQNTASDGDYVVALYEGLNNLKELVVDNGRYILRSCNEDKETYPDIYPRDLKIQGVAVCVMHRLKKRR